MKLIDLIHVELSYLQGCEWMMYRQKVSIFCEFIYHYKNGIELIRLDQSLNKIQANNFPSL